MNLFWLYTAMVAMLIGGICIALFFLNFLLKKLKCKRKRIALVWGLSFLLFFISAFAYDATLSEEQRIEIEKRQLIKEQNEQLTKQKENQADKELVEVEESSEMQEQLEVVESYTEEISTEESVSEQNIPEQKQSVCEETSI